MQGTPYNLRNNEFYGDMAAWLQSHAEDNEEELLRLKRSLRRAREEELTARQRLVLHMHFDENKRVSAIARELGVDKSTVSRTITRAKKRLYHCLHYLV